MNIKKFVIFFVFGFTAYWLLGGLFYAFIFKSLLPAMPEGENPDMMKWIFIGCIIMTILYAFIYTRIGGLNSYKDGIINGGIMNLIVAAAMHSFYFTLMQGWTMPQRLVDLFINFLMGAITSCVMYFAYNKICKSES